MKVYAAQRARKKFVDTTNATANRMPDTGDTSVTNIFIVYSPLHYLAAERIKSQFGEGARNLLYYLKPEFGEIINKSLWHTAGFLPWPRFYPEKGFLGRLQRTKKNLELVGSACSGSKEIRLHTPVIDTEAVNYLINYLRSLFPAASFSVRLTPDGLLNMQRHPLGSLKTALQHLKKSRRLLSPSLNYYTFNGDRIGSDAEIVDRIYVLQGIPHEYQKSKCVTITLPCAESRKTCSADDNGRHKRALVIGQPLTAYNRLTKQGLKSVSDGIRNFLKDCEITDIDYKSHPRDADHELGHPDYRELLLDKPLETYLANTSINLVIGSFSAALLTARLILPRSCRVVAYGMDQISYRGDKEKNNLQNTFRSAGVEMINHGTSQTLK